MRPKVYRNAWTRVFYFDSNAGTVVSLDEEGKPHHAGLESLVPVFGGKCITTNIMESLFSTIKQLLNFRGHRSVEEWRNVLKACIILWSCPELLDAVLDKLETPIQTRGRAINGMQFGIKKTMQQMAAA